jgi:hypothetical protein
MRKTLLLIPLLALAGCAGTTKTPGVATANGGTTPSAGASTAAPSQGDGLKFAQCMRENGLPSFKDPDPDAKGFSIHIDKGMPKAKVDAAMKACRQFMPNGGEPPKLDPALTAKLREYSKCMRANGVPDFPDPSPDGGIQLKAEPGSGLDPDSATFKKADEACSQYRPEGPDGDGGQKHTEQG